jgi:hypothetical protein
MIYDKYYLASTGILEKASKRTGSAAQTKLQIYQDNYQPSKGLACPSPLMMVSSFKSFPMAMFHR